MTVAAEQENGSARSAARRELGLVVLLTLIGGGGIVGTSSRAWFDARITRQAPFGTLNAGITGRHLYPALNGLAVVALLIAVLVLVTGGWARRVLGVLLLVVGGWSGWYAVKHLRTKYFGLNALLGDKLSQSSGTPVLTKHPIWAWLTLLCAVALVVAAVVLVLRSGRWQAGLSKKYEAPVEVAKSGDPWRSLDRGEDPTVGDG